MEEQIIKIIYQEKEYKFNIIKGVTYYIYFDYENNFLYKTKIKNKKEEPIEIIKL